MSVDPGQRLRPPPVTPTEQNAGRLAERQENEGQSRREIMGSFDEIGEGYDPAMFHDDTNERLRAIIDQRTKRGNESPLPVAPWECRIGLSRFFVPPVNINVSQTYKSGSMTGSALRQQNSPKFNSGHTETTIQMTLYFPNMEQIWGYGRDGFNIDFNEDDAEAIDTFLSSFRGLVAQFKYAPFLPIRNKYLNQVFGITGVVMQNMTVSTVEGFPFCLAVTLTMLKFNHKVYLPMVKHFDQAIHWGRFRQYMGRAVSRLRNVTTPIAVFDPTQNQINNDESRPGNIEDRWVSAEEVLATVDLQEEGQGRLNYDRLVNVDNMAFDFYYPFHTPARIDLPSLRDLRYYDINSTQLRRTAWHNLLALVGINPNTYPEARFDSVENSDFIDQASNEYRILLAYINRFNFHAEHMGLDKLEELIAQRAAELGIIRNGALVDAAAYGELEYRLRTVWFGVQHKFLFEDPLLARALAFQDQRQRKLTVREWDVPMVKLGLDLDSVGKRKNAVIIKGVAVTLGNTIARLQLQMQDEPTHQHIGGQDARIDISLIVTGEYADEELLKLRKMFENISGLARLEHGHGVLGFVGLVNPIVGICGIKYAIPMGFEVNTVPNHPNTYEVRITLTDFDVFQQKREMLTAEQQAELIEAFSKANPFLRLKQLWGMFNAYPDFPLAVRDDDGRIVGHLDPDYYFHGFKGIDDDIVEWEATDGGALPGAETVDPASPDLVRNEGINVYLGRGEGGTAGAFSYGRDGMSGWNGNEPVFTGARMKDVTAANVSGGRPAIEGLTPMSGYANPYIAGSDPAIQYATMMKDMQYRDKTGRMIRAYPTYMLWLIDEGGTFAGIKMFDNFYGLQSVLDFSIVESTDILGDTLVMRVSNLYSRLTTDWGAMFDENFYSTARLINTQTRRTHRYKTGLADELIQLDTIKLKPGVRVHMRMGYGANPNVLDTVFNGTITQVEVGDVMTITAQSDAIELGALVNTTNKKGHTGKIDGAMVGWYMSEPRDLMITLLTQGSSIAKEVIANATRGAVFSENRFGIRHFGMMLRVPLSAEEEERNDFRKNFVYRNAEELTAANQASDEPVTAVPAMEDLDITSIMRSMWTNVAAKRDYELFKRNIYPGNGLGIDQYMGGDVGDIGLTVGINGTRTVTGAGGVNPDGTVQDTADAGAGDTTTPDSEGEVPENFAEDTPWWLYATGSALGAATGGVGTVLTGIAAAFFESSHQGHRFREMFHITSGTDDDLAGFDEVSFRAQTHMKTVWDLFLVCAALLPDYIVAVRPFEDRSTIFYGKPHWLYTSGVIPMSTGLKPARMPDTVEPDEEWQDLFKKLEEALAKTDDLSAYETFKQGIANVAPVGTTTTDTSGGSAGTASPTDGKGYTVEDFMAALMGQESGGNAEARNEGTGAYGLWQIMPDNWPAWAQAAGLSPQAAQTPENQYIVARAKMIEYFNDYGSWEAVAVSWFAGPDDGAAYKRNPNDQTVLSKSDGHATVGQYIEKMQVAISKIEPGSTVDPISGQRSDGATTENSQAGRTARQEQQDAQGATARYEIPAGELPEWAKGPDGFAISSDLEGWALNHGWHQVGIPVNFTTVFVDEEGETTGDKLVDETGKTAEEIYKDHRTKEQANEIWDEFREKFPGDGQVKDIWDALQEEKVEVVENGEEAEPVLPPQATQRSLSFKSLDDRSNSGGNVSNLPYTVEPVMTIVPQEIQTYLDSGDYSKAVFEGSPKNSWLLYPKGGGPPTRIPQPEAGWTAPTENTGGGTPGSSGDRAPSTPGTAGNVRTPTADNDFEEELHEFMKFMWTNPQARGWLIYVTDKQAKIGDEDLSDFSSNVWDAIGGVIPGTQETLDNDMTWSLWQAKEAWAQWLFQDKNEQRTLEWMGENMEAGTNSNNISTAVGDALDELGIFQKLKRIFNGLTAVATGALQFVRLGVMQLSMGMSQAMHMQKQTNMLNRSHNDSIYYAAGRDANGKIVNPILYYADNPFTREYGEPVAEIREPFQRIHFISSFQNILNNGIIENGNVPTVVTATSNGAHPVTVHFDKAAPAERQLETVVDTGLYVDHPKGWFGLKKILNPIETSRWISQINSDDAGADVSPETSAKRVALWHLKENLKDLYTGEITILGDASMRPHDLLFIGDVYERMYGFVEIEQVVHHFTPETGFVTSITPDACVTVNDPARFSLTSYWRTRLMVQSARNHMRESFGVAHTNEDDVTYGEEPAGFENRELTLDELEQKFETEIFNGVQYTGGSTALVKAIVAYGSSGALAVSQVATGGLAAPVMLFVGWKIWSWVRDNLLDQHGCYIQYLTHNGQPMDGNLTGNIGVAVGHQNSMGLMIGGLKLFDIPTLSEDGSPVIRTSDVLPALKWTRLGPSDYAQQTDMYVDLLNSQMRQALGRGADGYPFIPNEVYWVSVDEVSDGDTINITVLGSTGRNGQWSPGGGGLPTGNSGSAAAGQTTIRLAASQAPEIPDELHFAYDTWIAVDDAPDGPFPQETLDALPGIRSSLFTYRELQGRSVALRVVPVDRQDQYGRVLAYIFNDAPEDLSIEQRRDYLLALAGGWPHVEWNSYNDDTGRPMTHNWSLIANGHADVFTADLKYSIPDSGVEGHAEDVYTPPSNNGGGT